MKDPYNPKNTQPIDPVSHLYSYIQRFGAKKLNRISYDDMLDLMIPCNSEELKLLIVNAESDPELLKDYCKMIQEESNSIKNALREPIGARQSRNNKSQVLEFYHFIKAAEYIVQNFRTEEIAIIDAQQLQKNKDKIKTVYNSIGKNLSEIDLEMTGAVKSEASQKLNRHNPKADLESFKKPGVYIYPLEEDLTKTKYVPSQEEGYYKRSDQRESDPARKRKIDFNIPEGQRVVLDHLKEVVGSVVKVENFEASRIGFPPKNRLVGEEPANKRQKTEGRTPF